MKTFFLSFFSLSKRVGVLDLGVYFCVYEALLKEKRRKPKVECGYGTGSRIQSCLNDKDGFAFLFFSCVDYLVD
jgi:hypothetical protein